MANDAKEIANSSAETSRIYSLFYAFFLIPLMIVIFGILFYLLFAVITDEPTNVNQLLIKLESGSIRDKANASYRMNKLFFNDSTKYNSSYRERIIRIHKMSKSEFSLDNTLRLHTIMIMGNSRDNSFGPNLLAELNQDDEGFRIKAIEALGKIQYFESASVIKNYLSKDNSFLEKLAAVGALGNIGNKAAITDLVILVNAWPIDWLESDGPELRWEAAIALLKLGYTNSKTITIINNLLDRNYYLNPHGASYNKLNENTINFVILKILNILSSIKEKALLQPFNDKIKVLSIEDLNLEIRDFAKKYINQNK